MVALQVEEHRRSDGNLGRIFGIGKDPSDTQMREILDPVDPQQLRSLFKDIFFDAFELESMEMVYTAPLNGYRRPKPEILYDDP